MTTYISLAPTVGGYRNMQRLFRESVESHRETIDDINDLMSHADSSTFSAFNDVQRNLVIDGLALLIDARCKDIYELNEQIQKIEVFCSLVESGY